ncbi:38283_t:CDS:2, partial [Gigaspora margarita]
ISQIHGYHISNLGDIIEWKQIRPYGHSYQFKMNICGVLHDRNIRILNEIINYIRHLINMNKRDDNKYL